MNDALSRFRDAIRATGLEPPDVVEPGRVHRFPGLGKRPGNRAGWCLLFADGLGGCYGDWSSGISRTWFSDRNRSRSPQAQAALSRQIKTAKLQTERAIQARHAEAANRARQLWDKAPTAPRYHAYLVAKGIGPYNARLHKGCLVLPVTHLDGSISSLQFIAPDGDKRLLSRGCKRGCCITVAGDAESAQRVIICEGWATGCTLAEDDPTALVLAAIDAGNLQPVAVATRRRWPDAELVIAGDDDQLTPGNPGATKARNAAIAADALLALPEWPADAPEHLTDFHDLAQWLKESAA